MNITWRPYSLQPGNDCSCTLGCASAPASNAAHKYRYRITSLLIRRQNRSERLCLVSGFKKRVTAVRTNKERASLSTHQRASLEQSATTTSARSAIQMIFVSLAQSAIMQRVRYAIHQDHQEWFNLHHANTEQPAPTLLVNLLTQTYFAMLVLLAQILIVDIDIQ